MYQKNKMSNFYFSIYREFLKGTAKLNIKGSIKIINVFGIVIILHKNPIDNFYIKYGIESYE